MELKETLNLPSTDFPMRASLSQREPLRMQHWQRLNLYGLIQKKTAGRPTFMLHDGPPFTNGDVHIGTALNKVIKDIIIRFKTMTGFRAPYVPGWDCHGLPIEHKVARQLQEEGRLLSPLELRKNCAQFARDFSLRQRQQFERLGLLADWDREYRTMDGTYEASVFEFLATCVDRGLIYRSKKPVYWSIPCRTALAEAEIEYRPHKSPSIWVRFAVKDSQQLFPDFDADRPIYLVPWTTTPWTLPANLALAVHPKFTYVALDCGGPIYIVAQSLADDFLSACGLGDARPLITFPGERLAGLRTRHPFLDRDSPVLLADFVTADTGTGCVHIAPGFGMEDYLLGLRNQLPPYCPLDDSASYVDDGQIPAALVGLKILDESGGCPANGAVLDLLRAADALLGLRPIVHSYPHCWRSKTPVIFRAMDQWFIRLEGNGLKEQALEAIETVNWIPGWGKNRIIGAVEARPDWCISRQRVWGIPLPVFVDEEGNFLFDGQVIRGLARKIRSHGSDCWFTSTAEELLDGIELPKHWQGKKLRQGTDTVDVWIDSGSSSTAVLKAKEGLSFPADLYCEGSDQHRGWFQSSLWCSLIANDHAPYRSILTHGFIVGEDRKKISKSDGKPQTADDYVNRYGADVVRLWIASEDFRSDIPVSDDILGHVVGAYQTLRNALRFELANLYDFDAAKDAVSLDQLTVVDRWALEKTRRLILEVTAAYGRYEFHQAYRSILTFCTVVLSATYHDLLKDRLYTFAAKDAARRSAQTALHEILQVLLRLLAPIIPFTADEANSHLNGHCEFHSIPVQLLDWPSAERFDGHGEVGAEVDLLLELRDEVNRKIEELRRGGRIGKSLDASVQILLGEKHRMSFAVKKHRSALAELLIVSQVEVNFTVGDACLVAVDCADGDRCSRCWRRVQSVSQREGGMLCERCEKALLDFRPPVD